MKPTIFICTHKDFDLPVKSSNYQILDSRKITVDLPFDDKFYSELYQYKYVYDSLDIPSYIGFCHYRRYFSFMDEIPTLDGDKVIVTKPMVFNGTVRQHYGLCHNIDDINLIEKIIRDKYPDYYDTCEKFLNGTYFIPCNMFIMSSSRFKQYIEFIFGVMDEYLKIIKYDIEGRINKNKYKYIKNFHPNNTFEYQYRIGGYIMERLTNIFILKNFNIKDIEFVDMVVTEDKYQSL